MEGPLQVDAASDVKFARYDGETKPPELENQAGVVEGPPQGESQGRVYLLQGADSEPAIPNPWDRLYHNGSERAPALCGRISVEYLFPWGVGAVMGVFLQIAAVGLSNTSVLELMLAGVATGVLGVLGGRVRRVECSTTPYVPILIFLGSAALGFPHVAVRKSAALTLAGAISLVAGERGARLRLVETVGRRLGETRPIKHVHGVTHAACHDWRTALRTITRCCRRQVQVPEQ